MSVKAWMRTWFPAVWPDRQLRLQLAAEYGAFGRSALADIAMRNYLFARGPDANDLFGAGVIEGRRRAALEIFDLCRVHPTEVADIAVTVARPTTKGDDDAGTGSDTNANWERYRHSRGR